MSTPIYYSTYNYRKNITLYWQQYFPKWQIPTGYIVHHIKPKSICKQEEWSNKKMNHPKNLIALHPDDHRSIHICRGDRYVGKFTSITGLLNSGKNNGMFGKVPWNKGVKQAEHVIESALAGGKKWRDMGGMDDEYRSKISKALKGVPKPQSFIEHLKLRTGKKHPAFKGYYHTPLGKLTASTQIEDQIANQLIRKWCKNPSNIITMSSYSQVPYLQSLGLDIIGLSFRDIGFYFEPIKFD